MTSAIGEIMSSINANYVIAIKYSTFHDISNLVILSMDIFKLVSARHSTDVNKIHSFYASV